MTSPSVSAIRTRSPILKARVYVMTMPAMMFATTEVEDSDEVFESHGIKVIVDRKSLIYLDGTELDFKREGLNEGFEFKNPNVKDACGCGESFTV